MKHSLKTEQEYAIDKLGFPKMPVLENFRDVLLDTLHEITIARQP